MKKMRRMIPALCMLLVSAIMMTTASYAWFTMNEKVEATGMQVQAQAGGAMVISTTKLHEGSQDWTVDFATDSRIKKIGPMTRLNGAWKVPQDGKEVDGATGHYDGAWKDATGSTTYIDYTVYVAVTGDEVTKNIKASLSTESTLGIAGAYAVAFYVNPAVDADIATLEPALILHVAENKYYGEYAPTGGQYEEAGTASKSVSSGLLFESPTKIESTIGVAENNNGNGVGTQIVMRVFVDGTLRTGDAAYVQEPKYEQVGEDATYNSSLSYFVYVDSEEDDDADPDHYEPAPIANVNVGDAISADWFIYRGMQNTTAELPVYYVRNKTAPEAPTGLNVAFELVDDSRTGA